jgi:hypothetical protein
MRGQLLFSVCVAAAAVGCGSGDHELAPDATLDAAADRVDGAVRREDAGKDGGDSSVKDATASREGSVDGSERGKDSSAGSDGSEERRDATAGSDGSADASEGAQDATASSDGPTDGSEGGHDATTGTDGSTTGPCILDTSALDHCLL